VGRLCRTEGLGDGAAHDVTANDACRRDILERLETGGVQPSRAFR